MQLARTHVNKKRHIAPAAVEVSELVHAFAHDVQCWLGSVRKSTSSTRHLGQCEGGAAALSASRVGKGLFTRHIQEEHHCRSCRVSPTAQTNGAFMYCSLVPIASLPHRQHALPLHVLCPRCLTTTLHGGSTKHRGPLRLPTPVLRSSWTYTSTHSFPWVDAG